MISRVEFESESRCRLGVLLFMGDARICVHCICLGLSRVSLAINHCFLI